MESDQVKVEEISKILSAVISGRISFKELEMKYGLVGRYARENS